MKILFFSFRDSFFCNKSQFFRAAVAGSTAGEQFFFVRIKQKANTHLKGVISVDGESSGFLGLFLLDPNSPFLGLDGLYMAAT